MPAFIVSDPDFEPVYRTAGDRLELKELRRQTRERAADFEEHVTVWDHADLNLDPDFIGLDGSPTIVSSVDPIPKAPAEREATMVDPADTDAMQQVVEELTPFAESPGAAEAGGD